MKCRAITAAIALTGVIACGPDRPDPAAHPDEVMSTARGRRLGVVQLVHSEGHRLHGTSRLLVSAAFVRTDGLDRGTVARVLGLPDIPDAADFESAQCAVSSTSVSASMDEAGGAPAVELLDAGALELRAGPETITVPSQYFPDVVSNIAGVTYEATVRSRSALPTTSQGLRATIAASGSVDVGAFEVSLQVPARLRLVEVGGRAVRHGVVMAELTGELGLSWEPPSRDSDLLVVEVARQSFGSVSTVRCLAPDNGAFAVPGEMLARLPPSGPDTTDRLSVRRIMLQPFDAPGLHEGLAVYVTEDAVLLR
ncbi:MAG: hypothetical protein AMXMBFR64_35550 [Myxococcales bacterium]